MQFQFATMYTLNNKNNLTQEIWVNKPNSDEWYLMEYSTKYKPDYSVGSSWVAIIAAPDEDIDVSSCCTVYSSWEEFFSKNEPEDFDNPPSNLIWRKSEETFLSEGLIF